jgi:hypothetical protein
MELSFPAGSSLHVIEHDAIIDLKVLLTQTHSHRLKSPNTTRASSDRAVGHVMPTKEPSRFFLYIYMSTGLSTYWHETEMSWCR